MRRRIRTAHGHAERTQMQWDVLEDQYQQVTDLLSEIDGLADKLSEVAQNVSNKIEATNGQ